MKILVTGGAGFIGSHTTKRLVADGHEVVAVDNFSEYYDREYKQARYDALVGDSATFIEADISSLETVERILSEHSFDAVIHLAGRGGVRDSTKHPWEYERENILATNAILEGVRQHGVGKLLLASSSAVYGDSQETPFSEDQHIDFPLSVYAATKRANELMAHTYAHLYDMNIVVFRFFTVYGPWGRPYMAFFDFADAMRNKEEISIFYSEEFGVLKRDYTYVDDIVSGIVSSLGITSPFEIINLGKGHPDSADDLVDAIERHLGVTARKNKKVRPLSDVCITWADISKAEKLIGYKPTTTLDEGIASFARWYKDYFNMNS